MSRAKLFAFVGLALSSLGACALVGPNLEATRTMTPTGSAFDKALYHEYLVLAQTEYDEGDTGSATFFNKKAIAAAKGEKVLPMTVAEHPIPNVKGSVFEAEVTHDTIMRLLKEGAAEKAPNQIARAQVMYDCWLEEFAEHDESSEIKRCSKGLDEALNKAQALTEGVAMASPEPAAKPTPAAPKEFVLLFGFNSSKLTADDMTKVHDIAAMKPTSVKVTGYTDTAGSKAYNERLSRRRAEAVAKALVAAGVAKGGIDVAAEGENSPARATGDNVKEPLNRRVTVVVE